MAFGARQSHRWVTYTRPPANARLVVFCFPNAGSGVNNLRTWSNALPPDVTLGLVQLPGRESRFSEPPYVRIGDLVNALLDNLRSELTGTFAFFGHSMGAIIAYELARALSEQNRPTPKALLVSGRRAPQCPSRFPDMHGLPDTELVERMRELGGTPEDVLSSAELMEILLPVMRADVELTETYSYAPGALLDCPVTAYGGLQDQFVNDEELAAWREQTTGPFQSRRFPGGHFFIHDSRDEFLKGLASDLGVCGRSQ